MTGDISGPDYDYDWTCWGYAPRAGKLMRWLVSESVD